MIVHAKMQSPRRASIGRPPVHQRHSHASVERLEERIVLSTFSTLASFAGGGIGTTPEGPLVQDAAGDLFGYNAAGGANNTGTVFELPHGSTTLTTVASFPAETTAGSTLTPAGLAIDASGNLFGMLAQNNTTVTATSSNGTLFEILKGSGTLTALASFSPLHGDIPSSLTLDSNDDIFGTTVYQGGPVVAPYGPNGGTVYELPYGTSTIAVTGHRA